MVKGFKQTVILTMFSRVLGMVREMVFANFLGAGGAMDGWVIAFMIPNLSRRIFGEGAATSSLIPIYTAEQQKDKKYADKIAMTLATVVTVILTAATLLGFIIVWLWHQFFTDLAGTELKLRLTAIMLPYMILICTVAVLSGILNANRHFAAPAAAPIVLNIFIISALWAGSRALHLVPNKLVFFVGWTVLLAGVVQVFMQIVPLKIYGVSLKPAWEIRSDAFKRMLLLMGPMVLGVTATQINTLADNFIAAGFSGSAEKGETFMFFGRQIAYPLWEGAVSRLYYAQRLYQLPLGVLGISLATVIFPVMSRFQAAGDRDGLVKTIRRGIEAAIFIALPATAGLVIIRNPLVELLYERGKFSSEDTTATAAVLAFYSLGLCGYFMQQILTRAFYSVQHSSTPAKSAATAVVINTVLNLAFIWVMGTAGLALATAISAYVQVCILGFSLNNRLGKGLFIGLWNGVFKTIISAAVMTIVCLAVMKLGGDSAKFKILLAVPAGGAAYVISAWFLKIESLKQLLKFKEK